MTATLNTASAGTVTLRPEPTSDFVPPMGVLVRDLGQLAALVSGLTDDQYARAPVGVFSSGIGSHVRHCLDHVQAYLGGLETGLVDYDHRVRGTDVEHSRLAALRAIRGLQRRLSAAHSLRLDQPLTLRIMLTPRGPAVDVPSSLGRELAFALSHNTHHHALIAAIIRTMGISLPDDFGYAPSTLAYHQSTTCAR